MLPTNQLLNKGRYRISQSLGQNGVGMLYEAYDNVTQSKVVVKEIVVKMGKVATASQQESLKYAFDSEAKTLKEINHEGFLRIHDYFSEIDRHYIVLESSGESNLKDLLEKKGAAFPYTEVIGWADQTLAALNYLHSQMPPVVHRDVKPQSLKLTADGKIKLSAPEISRNLSEKISKTDVTQPAAASSLHFLPLEQIWEGLDAASQKVITNSYNEKSEEILKQPTDAASDIYSLGATLYYLLTAQAPIDSLERSIDILEGKTDPLRSPHEINPNVPAELSGILMKALEIKRENRFSAISIMRQVLRTAVLQIQERAQTEPTQTAAVSEKAAAKNVDEKIRQEKEALLLAEQKQIELQAEQKRIAEERRLTEQKQLEREKLEREKLEQQQLEREKIALEKIAQEKIEQENLARKQREIAAERIQPNAPNAPQNVQTAAPKTAAIHKTDQPLFSDDDLLELEVEKPVAETIKPATVPVKAAKTAAAAAAATTLPVAAAPAAIETAVDSAPIRNFASDDNNILFAEAQKPAGNFWKIPAAALAFIVLGGAGFGIWYSQSGNGASSAPPVQAVTANEPAKPAAAETNTAAAEPTAKTENASAPAVTENAPSLTENAPATDTAPAAIKTKPAAAPNAPKPKKQSAATPPPQTADNQKKPITVDDLINDN